MHGERAGSRADSDVQVYYPSGMREVEEQPVLDLRTRLVLWFLGLFFVGLVYLGLYGTPV